MSSTLVMENVTVAVRMPFPPKKREVFYPESDGKPMAETDTHRNLMFDIIETLKRRFAADADVYVTGNIMFYYVEGDPHKSISPDAMVVKGVEKRDRRTFRLWDERPPCVVFEISSRKTKSEDFKKKLQLYAQFGVPEYYIFDPEQMNAAKAWTVFHLMNGEYRQVAIENGRIYSPELGLEIVQVSQTLRFFDPATQELLPTNEEVDFARQHAEAEKQRAEAERDAEAVARRQAESEAAQKDAEIARLLAELARLRGL